MLRRRLPRFGLFLAILTMAGIWLGQTSGGAAAPASITLFHFNDAHEMDATEGGSIGGLARVATALSRVKRQTSPLLVTFGGDFLSPAAIGTAIVDGQPLAGRQAVAVMNMIGVEWATFGNHEFDLSEAAFRTRLSEKKFGIVSTNVTDTNGQPFPGTVRSAVVPLRAGGRTWRVGLLGFTLSYNRKPWVQYQSPIESAKRELEILRGKTDTIVAITHLGIPGDIELVSAVPDIDLVLGGHEHENWILERGQRMTPIMKADANGRSAVVATMTWSAPGQRPTISGRVLPLGADVPPDPAVRAEIARWMELGFAGFRKAGFAPEATVAAITEPLDGRESTVRIHSGNLTDLILAAMLRESPGASVAILNGGSIRVDDVIPVGPLRQYDILRVVPFGGRVVSASLEGALLSRVLDVGAANVGTGGYLHAAGVDRTQSGWAVGGEPIDPRRHYRVALPDFLLTGAERNLDFLTRANPGVQDIREYRDVRLALIEELKRRYP